MLLRNRGAVVGGIGAGGGTQQIYNGSSNNSYYTNGGGGGGADLEVLCTEIEQGFLELESILYGASSSTIMRDLPDGDLEQRIKRLGGLLGRMGEFVPKERDPARRDVMRKRLEGSNQRLIEVTRYFEMQKIKRDRSDIEKKNRNALLGLSNNNNKDHVTAVQSFVAENQALKETNRNLQEIIFTAENVNSNIIMQTETMKRAISRLGVLAQSIGISSSLLKAVQRVEFGDRVLVFVGMFLICIFLYFVYTFAHR